eukprot:300277-Pleurochrysis_carterae.AAC.2
MKAISKESQLRGDRASRSIYIQQSMQQSARINSRQGPLSHLIIYLYPELDNQLSGGVLASAICTYRSSRNLSNQQSQREPAARRSR